jgi:hypothetical protein
VMSTCALSIIFNVRYRLIRYAPADILLVRTYGRHGIRWLLLSVGWAALYFHSATICTTPLIHEDPGCASTPR